ncbi:hypothetical protein C3B44_08130 [Corynebacterium yudongzhengii]|nr:hypothetical protein C3B44_08130 [Corynebacterium yudongzhengii]
MGAVFVDGAVVTQGVCRVVGEDPGLPAGNEEVEDGAGFAVDDVGGIGETARVFVADRTLGDDGFFLPGGAIVCGAALVDGVLVR